MTKAELKLFSASFVGGTCSAAGCVLFSVSLGVESGGALSLLLICIECLTGVVFSDVERESLCALI